MVDVESRLRSGVFVGVAGRSRARSGPGSARRINCRGIKGEVLRDWGEMDLIDLGLCPLGVTKEKDGTNDVVGSGV